MAKLSKKVINKQQNALTVSAFANVNVRECVVWVRAICCGVANVGVGGWSVA